MALPAGRYGVTKNQLLKIKKLPMNTIKLIEELTEKFDLLGSAAFKNSTSVVTDSSDLVESGAVFDAIKGSVGFVTTGKNLLNNTATNKSTSDISFTVNADKSVTINGTATANRILALNDNFDSTALAGCLANGLSNISGLSYRVTSNDYATTYQTIDEDDTAIIDNGSGLSFYIRVANGTVCNNVTIYPMIRKADVTDDTYEPYHASVEEYCASKDVLKNTVGWISEDVAKLYSYTTTSGSVTFTYTKDYVELNGTAESNNSQPTSSGVPDSGKFTLSAGTYKIVSETANAHWEVVGFNPVEVLSTGGQFTLSSERTVFLRIGVNGGTTYNHQKCYVKLQKISVDEQKADNSVIGTVENGSTASQDYAVGEHFIRDGAFCTCKQAISQGGSFTLGTNYTAGDVASCLVKQATFSGTTSPQGNIRICNNLTDVILAVKFNTEYIFNAGVFYAGTEQGVHVVETNGQIYAEKAVSGTYYYI